MELATALIWMLRILLPVILFCIYFKLQAPKDGEGSTPPGPSGQCYARGQLLNRRKATVDSPAPEEIADITLKTQEQAPALFAAGRGRGPRGGGEGGGRSRGERGERGERGDRPDREKRSEGGRRGDRGAAGAPEEEDAPESVEAVDAARAALAETEDKMNMESLLNYVAFNRKEQQRVFLPDVSAGAPPPPPPPPPRNARGAQDQEAVSGAAAEKANAEVQMVLRGAMKFNRAEVSNPLYERLVDQQVEISQSTFTLMIEACVLARELKFASDFLLKMETAGFCPDSELLDKVMDLYSQQKAQREAEKKEQEELEVPFDPAVGLNQILLSPEEMAEGMRAKLSATAPAFVPSFADNDSAPVAKLSTEAAPFVPIAEALDGGVAPAAGEGEGDGVVRTKLKVSAQAFTPSFGAPAFTPSMDGTYDPAYDMNMEAWMYGGWTEDDWCDEQGWDADNGTWDSTQDGAHDGAQDANGKKGKGRGKDKAKGKSKGKSNGEKDTNSSEQAKGKAKGRSKGGKDANSSDVNAKEAQGKAKADGKGKGNGNNKEGSSSKREAAQEKDGKAKAKPKAKAEAKWKAKDAA